VDAFLDKFLVSAVISISHAWYHYLDLDDGIVQFSFDAKNKRILRSAPCLLAESSSKSNIHVEKKWFRDTLEDILRIYSDEKLQQDQFVKNPKGQMGWFDYCLMYFEDLNFEEVEISDYQKKGYLTSEEAKALQPFHQKFRIYSPKDESDAMSILKDPQWKEIVPLAQTALKAFKK
jgi:hypothetical protein